MNIDLKTASPREVRALIRAGEITSPTAGMAAGYAQANLVILPAEYAADFAEYARINPAPCPVLETLKASPYTRLMAADGNILTDIPKYRIYRSGALDAEVTDASEYYQSGMVGFLIGCSFSFEEALMRAGIEVRHIAMGRNVPMYKTNIMTKPCGPFSGPTVCSMRPMTREQAALAYKITAAMPNVHGAPVHIGDPKDIGIADVMRGDTRRRSMRILALRRYPAGGDRKRQATHSNNPQPRAYVHNGHIEQRAERFS